MDWYYASGCLHMFFVQRYAPHVTVAKLDQLSAEAEASAEVSAVHWSALNVPKLSGSMSRDTAFVTVCVWRGNACMHGW